MDFLTIYRKDYIPKHWEKVLSAKSPPEYDDPISGPCLEYLPPPHKLDMLNISSNYEHPDKYSSRLLKQRPNLKRSMFAEPLDHKIVKDVLDCEGKTTYQVHYCYDSQNPAVLENTGRPQTGMVLPDNWDIPATTHRASYRHPSVMSQFINMRPRKARLPVENLRPDEKLRSIMKVKTGESEYQGRIGQLGQDIVKNKYYGEMKRSKVPTIWELRQMEAGLTNEESE